VGTVFPKLCDHLWFQVDWLAAEKVDRKLKGILKWELAHWGCVDFCCFGGNGESRG